MSGPGVVEADLFEHSLTLPILSTGHHHTVKEQMFCGGAVHMGDWLCLCYECFLYTVC